jgi:hypothetical protein
MTMKVRMTKTAAGPDGIKLAGKVYDVPSGEAKALVAAQAAVFVEKPVFHDEAPVGPETASIEPEEAAVEPKPQPKKGRGRKK